ncbi:MAG: 4Fe-4S binding protein, partial [Deltaproteobacteria bacterium]|nr:4Fe-4S binding protein [Deltaproteobacteria bacterium]
MEWTSDAERAIKRVPFFVRKRVKERVEKEAGESGKTIVSLSEVKATQKKHLSTMSSEIKGFQFDTCFGLSGCPNRAVDSGRLLQKIEKILEKEKLSKFLKQRVKGEIKFHHELRVTLADCPNACSQPQIKDIGIIGAITPVITDELCTLCEACVDVCRENAVTINRESDLPEIDNVLCLDCGQCVDKCPTGTLAQGKKGFRVQLGGKLGRHPVLAHELPGVYTEEEVIKIVKSCIAFYKKFSKSGERFA